MKTQLKTSKSFAILLMLLLLGGCTKEALKPTANNQESLQKLSVNATALTQRTLVLQPDAAEGLDAFLYYFSTNPDAANANQGNITVVTGFAWTNMGATTKGRTLIKFAGLSAIPDSAHIVSARLYLYGVSSSINVPQGNSTYPGSPYPLDNTMAIVRVTEPWDENTVTWNTQPDFIKKGGAIIPTSTAHWNYDVDINVSKMVAAMVAEPAKNYGFMIRIPDETYYKSMVFASSDDSIPARRPKLVVTYE